ncbi:MAG: sulfatase-like hydrolase/transferase [Chloroflexi bacterium]|nr:sulfatase-like hydrolase/transferase [Chloroflexota bacterium]MCL5273246.1 sulfatase-like hydrolase/transferase [Chloroflexota bacterium]
MPRQPNIILCTCDQLRAFETGCYGNPVIRTPNIDNLAAQSVRFEQAVTTFPVCMAARSVMLSGQYNRACTGGVGNVSIGFADGRAYFPQYPHEGRPHLKSRTLPETLRGSGYHTAAIGKWHIHSWPQDVGFDRYIIPRVNHVHTGQSYTEDGGPEFVPDGYSVDYECDRVEGYLRERAAGKQPFFLFYNISPPHCPLSDAPEKYLSLYRPEDVPLRPNVDLSQRISDQDHWFKVYRWDYRYYNFHLPYTEDLPDDYTLQKVIAEYYGLTTWVDDAVGRMLDSLEANGLAEDTIVVFTSDHGDYLGSHGRVQKGDLHEESVRIPLLVRWPGCLPPQVNRSQVAGLVDLAPTLLSLAGLQPPPHMHGKDLTPMLRDATPALAENWAYIEMGSGVGIRTPTHLYGLPFHGESHTLAGAPHYFFDLTRDPYQMRNLAGSAEQAELASMLDARLRVWDSRTPWMA